MTNYRGEPPSGGSASGQDRTAMPDRKEQPGAETGSGRQGQGLGRLVSKITLALIPVFGTSYVVHLPEYLGIIIYKEQYLSIILTLMLVSTFLGVPAKKHGLKNKTQWYDWVLALLSLVGGGYVALYYPDIIPTLGYLVPFRTVMGAMMLLLLLEATRRLVGWPIVIIGLFFPIYAATSYFLPGFLHSRMIPVGRVLSYLYLAPGAMFGIPLTVAATIVFSFIFFGRILFITGGGKFLSDFALALMGRYRGGPAKVAILASCFFGSLSGSASANVAMTGIVTIPLMKRTGYKPHMAGAIEAVASTGGLIMPPIMAATAFIMAEFLEIPYPRIALSALIPAVLYYVAVFIQVHLQAVKTNLRGLPRKEIPSLKEVMAKGWIYVIPVGVLLYCPEYGTHSQNSSVFRGTSENTRTRMDIRRTGHHKKHPSPAAHARPGKTGEGPASSAAEGGDKIPPPLPGEAPQSPPFAEVSWSENGDKRKHTTCRHTT